MTKAQRRIARKLSFPVASFLMMTMMMALAAAQS